MPRVAVVGASGRVGTAICSHLRPAHEVVEVGRREGEAVHELAARAATDVDLVINAAGMAHVERPTPGDIELLHAANVVLPGALASAALKRRIPMIHISSVKAVTDAPTPYGRSKFEGDQLLETRFGPAFAEANLGLVIIRPPALLFPPFDVGKLARLRFLRWWPAMLTPPIRLPVLTQSAFLNAMQLIVDDASAGSGATGISWRCFPGSERGTLRDVRLEMQRS